MLFYFGQAGVNNTVNVKRKGVNHYGRKRKYKADSGGTAYE